MEKRNENSIYLARLMLVCFVCLTVIIYALQRKSSHVSAQDVVQVSQGLDQSNFLPIVINELDPLTPTPITPTPTTPAPTPMPTTPTVIVQVQSQRIDPPFPNGGFSEGAVLQIGDQSVTFGDSGSVAVYGLEQGIYTATLNLDGYYERSVTVDFSPNNERFQRCKVNEQDFDRYSFSLALFNEDYTIEDVDGPLTLAILPSTSPSQIQDIQGVVPKLNEAYFFIEEFLNKPPDTAPQDTIFVRYDPAVEAVFGVSGFVHNRTGILVSEYPTASGGYRYNVAIHEIAHLFINECVGQHMGLSSVLGEAGWFGFVHVIVVLTEAYAVENIGFPEMADRLEDQYLQELSAYEQLGNPFQQLNFCDGRVVEIDGQRLFPFEVLSGMFIKLNALDGHNLFGDFLTQERLVGEDSFPECDEYLLSILGEYMVRASSSSEAQQLLSNWGFPDYSP